MDIADVETGQHGFSHKFFVLMFCFYYLFYFQSQISQLIFVFYQFRQLIYYVIFVAMQLRKPAQEIC
jgi:hypothetical protein